LCSKYEKSINFFKELKGRYEKLEHIHEFNAFIDEIAAANAGLKEPCSIVDKIVSHRASLLYPKEKRQKKAAKKKTVQSLLEDLDLGQYITVLDPSIIKGFRPFRLDDKISDKDQDDFTTDDCNRIREQYMARVRLVSKKDKALAELCGDFYDQYIGSNLLYPNSLSLESVEDVINDNKFD
jgi:hypothetical protein